MKKIVLASRSRRRSSILTNCRIPHRVVTSKVREDKSGIGDPGSVVVKNAYRKAREVAGRVKKGIVIGADTLVLSGGKLVGKLKTKAKVKEAIKEFQRGTFRVYTGLAVIDSPEGRSVKGYAVTKIRMKSLKDKEIDRWLGHLKPLDKAGGFSIEGPGAILFPYIKGCFYNILGLPMAKLDEMFKKLNYNLLDFMDG